jgi:hypothetical protein
MAAPEAGKIRPVRALLVVAMVGLTAAACGSGGNGSRLSKSQLDAKANAVCRKYTQKINAVAAPRNVADVPAYVARVKPYIQRGVAEIEKLKPPKDLQSTFDQWLETQRQALGQADDLRRAAEKNDLVGVNRVIHQLDERNKRGNALAAKLGATGCAQD